MDKRKLLGVGEQQQRQVDLSGGEQKSNECNTGPHHSIQYYYKNEQPLQLLHRHLHKDLSEENLSSNYFVSDIYVELEEQESPYSSSQKYYDY